MNTPKKSSENTYGEKILSEIGLTGVNEPRNLIKVIHNENAGGKHTDITEEIPFIEPCPEGFRLPIVSLDRLQTTHAVPGTKTKKPAYIIRHYPPIRLEDGTEMKYQYPSGLERQPYFPESIKDAFDNGTELSTLLITEGEKKTFITSLHGVPIIGVGGIFNLAEKKTGKLHSEILDVITKCNVKRLVFLLDGDADDISPKALAEKKDISFKPNNFLQAVEFFKNISSDLDLDLWCFIIKSNEIAVSKGIQKSATKGIDDLFLNAKGEENKIKEDLLSLGSSDYLYKINVTHNTKKLSRLLCLHDVNSFFLKHSEGHPDLLKIPFIFRGAEYKWDGEQEKCVKNKSEFADYFKRIRDDYFKIIWKLNISGKPEKQLIKTLKQTIIDDHGREILKHIKKYDDFCVFPSHDNYREDVANCYNLYYPLPYLPHEQEVSLSDIPNITKFLGHIAGNASVSYLNQKTKEKFECGLFDMLLDYFQIAYHFPERKLPILSLVSPENNTGKSTFLFLLRLIFGQNVAIVGNADLASDFNAHYLTKLFVCIDETFIEKRLIVEKIKSLSTAIKGYLNAKGREQVEVDLFMKFVLATNNEENFLSLSKEDIRFWIIRLKPLPDVEVDMLKKMEAEIPAFLRFLKDRKLITSRENRMHFHPDLLKTEALNKVIEYSQPSVEKDIRHYIKELFLDTGLDIIEMTQKVLHKEALLNKNNSSYLEKILKSNMKLLPYHLWEYNNKEFETKDEAITIARAKQPDIDTAQIEQLLKIKFKTKRYSYPKYQDIHENGQTVIKIIFVNDNGRPFVFYRKDFVPPADEVKPNDENQVIPDMLSENNSGGVVFENDLPFPISK